MTWLYLNVTRNCFSVPYALEKNTMIKKIKKTLPTYPNFFEHVAPNTYIFWPKQQTKGTEKTFCVKSKTLIK